MEKIGALKAEVVLLEKTKKTSAITLRTCTFFGKLLIEFRIKIWLFACCSTEI